MEVGKFLSEQPAAFIHDSYILFVLYLCGRAFHKTTNQQLSPRKVPSVNLERTKLIGLALQYLLRNLFLIHTFGKNFVLLIRRKTRDGMDFVLVMVSVVCQGMVQNKEGGRRDTRVAD